EWQEVHFTEDERSDPLISGLNADPDGDGLGNGLEFAFAADPRKPDKGPQIEVTVTEGLDLSYIRRRDSGLTFIVESSQDLETWAQANWIESGIPEPLDEVRERIRLQPTDETSITDGYLRLRVEGF